ncbi:hypothetical protein DTO027B3_8499 [Paecilomyces variotii]|nr:hypothetical protein DTO027B3_8499 [Paecilomyces variotii]
MAISAESASLGKTIQGKVDWCLSHGNNDVSELDTTLVVLEATKLGEGILSLQWMIQRVDLVTFSCRAFALITN